jgi:2-dehydro-3-deoxyphosphogluconate aldolase / (4S)-4-hydroxy-2-oxoglutarate aldolase
MTKEQALAGIQASGVLPLFYHEDLHLCEQALQALYAGGIRCVEFTNRGEKALANFEALVRLKSQMPGLALGIGTIHNTHEAAKFMAVGADFLVSPFFDTSLADYTYLQKKLWIPGCMTPTEIHQAHSQGCEWVKLFPGEVLGPNFLRAIRPLFRDMHFMVTGGVTPEKENLMQWLKAGASAVGLGSKLVVPDQLHSAEGLNQLTQTAQTVVDIVLAYKIRISVNS